MSTDLKILTGNLIKARANLAERLREVSDAKRYVELDLLNGLIHQAFASVRDRRQELQDALTEATGLPAYMFLELLR